MTGKVLVARRDTSALEAASKSESKCRDTLRIGAERARPDNRVSRIKRKIEHRREVHRAAGSSQIEGCLLSSALCQLEIA